MLVVACCTAIEVPLPITEPVPPVIVNILDVVSVKLPKVKALCFALNVLQSVDDSFPVFDALAVGIFKTIVPLEVIGLFVTLTSVPVVPVVNPTLVTVPVVVLVFVIVKVSVVSFVVTEMPVPATTVKVSSFESATIVF